MSTLYWINVLDNINFLFVLIFIASVLFSVASVFANLVCTTDEIFETLDYKHFIKAKHWAYTLLIISTLVITFVPSKRELYIIYGVGGTIDYLKDNPTAKELPDKCIKALDTWVDNFNKEEGNND
jgi:hypothetical protein